MEIEDDWDMFNNASKSLVMAHKKMLSRLNLEDEEESPKPVFKNLTQKKLAPVYEEKEGRYINVDTLESTDSLNSESIFDSIQDSDMAFQ